MDKKDERLHDKSSTGGPENDVPGLDTSHGGSGKNISISSFYEVLRDAKESLEKVEYGSGEDKNRCFVCGSYDNVGHYYWCKLSFILNSLVMLLASKANKKG